MKILVLNAGSSSIKYKFFDMESEDVLASGLVERIGEVASKIIHSSGGKEEQVDELISDHAIGLRKVAALLTEGGVIKSRDEVDVVTHRVVHGGEKFNTPTLLDDASIQAIRENIQLAPLHNPANLTGIEVAKEIFSNAKQIGVFDTSFHQTMPRESYLYAIPLKYYNEFKVRRYGFHGTSHSFVAKECAKFFEKDLSQMNLITVHLGNGCSITAIKNGESVDTSMGLTPLEGLMMGTRSGDIDPAIPYFLSTIEKRDISEIDTVLNKESGLKGISGSNDVRDILEKAESGDKNATFAIDMYTRRVKKYIGSYIAILGRVDAIVFTAGVGENSGIIREKICQDMEELGIKLDADVNHQRERVARDISLADSKIKVLSIPTNEELEMARESIKLI